MYDHRLSAAVAELEPDNDFILIDCPGSHTRLSQVAHSLADTLITPLNDSFIDFDLLAHIDANGEKITGPSVYSEMVWNARQLRAQAGLSAIDWVVVRNRMGAQRMVNKEKMERAIGNLSKRIGFRTAPGFNERVIFRELFPRGLTLLDLKDIGVKQLNISNIAARQELARSDQGAGTAGCDRRLLRLVVGQRRHHGAATSEGDEVRQEQRTQHNCPADQRIDARVFAQYGPDK